MYIYYYITSHQRSSLPLPVYSYVHTIPRWINELFQNGRALLKCRIFILLQLVIPTLKSHAATRHVTTRTCHCEQTFQDGPRIFRPCFCCVPVSCYLCCCRVHSSHSFRHFAANCPSFSYCFPRKFDRYWRHSDHRSLCFMLAVLL